MSFRLAVKRATCRHKRQEFQRNIYGDEMYLAPHSRSVWQCLDCGKLIGKREYGPSKLPELRIGQIVRPRIEDAEVDVLQAVVLAFTSERVTMQSITGAVVVMERENVVPLDIAGPVYMESWWEPPADWRREDG